MNLYQLLEYRKILLEFNVVNLNDIDSIIDHILRYDWTVNNPTTEVTQWFKKQVKNYLINSPTDNRLVTTDDVKGSGIDKPAWLDKAIERGDQLYYFSMSGQTKTHLEHICHWLEANPDIYPKLYKVTVPQAIEMSEKWTKSLNKKATTKEDEEGVVPFIDFPDGYRWVQLTSKGYLDREGKLMSHCVGSYFDRVSGGKTLIYSLRDPNNNPHCTIEVTNGTIKQIKGKQNKAPEQKYVPYVQEFIDKAKYKADTYDLQNLGFIFLNNKLYNIMKLPDGLVIDGDFDENNYLGYLPDKERVKFQLPKNLTVNNLTTDARSAHFLPEGLIVKKLLCLKRTYIEGLPEDTICNSLDISDTQIKVIPNNFSNIKGNFIATDDQLDKLPDNLSVGVILNLNGSTIKKLPKGLRVGSDLLLEKSKVYELPEGLYVGRDLFLENCTIEKFPKNYSIKGKVYGIELTKLEYIPDRTNYDRLSITSSSPVKAIGEGIVADFLSIASENITHLPQKLTVKKTLSIYKNHQIKTIPATIKVGSIGLVDTVIESLTPGLKLTELILKDNPNLKTLPDDLEVTFITISSGSNELIKWIQKSKFKDKLSVDLGSTKKQKA